MVTGARRFNWTPRIPQRASRYGARSKPTITSRTTGSNSSIGNVFPVHDARAFFEGMACEGQRNIVNLVHCSWARSQSYGALVWSDDIAPSWESMRNQLAAGLNMGFAGILAYPGGRRTLCGFLGGDPSFVSFLVDRPVLGNRRRAAKYGSNVAEPPGSGLGSAGVAIERELATSEHGDQSRAMKLFVTAERNPSTQDRMEAPRFAGRKRKGNWV
ncbi:hypothetical protein E4U41_000197 [Claviceps citrina]|nr:hypothetical protein E4U41_000197 [Claviceps citrina]